jgi:hypothetical protein
MYLRRRAAKFCAKALGSPLADDVMPLGGFDFPTLVIGFIMLMGWIVSQILDVYRSTPWGSRFDLDIKQIARELSNRLFANTNGGGGGRILWHSSQGRTLEQQ